MGASDQEMLESIRRGLIQGAIELPFKFSAEFEQFSPTVWRMYSEENRSDWIEVENQGAGGWFLSVYFDKELLGTPLLIQPKDGPQPLGPGLHFITPEHVSPEFMSFSRNCKEIAERKSPKDHYNYLGLLFKNGRVETECKPLFYAVPREMGRTIQRANRVIGEFFEPRMRYCAFALRTSSPEFGEVWSMTIVSREGHVQFVIGPCSAESGMPTWVTVPSNGIPLPMLQHATQLVRALKTGNLDELQLVAPPEDSPLSQEGLLVDMLGREDGINYN